MRASACSRVPIWMPSSSTRRITSVPSFRSNRRRTAAGIKILPDFSTLTEIVSIRQFYHNMNGPGLLTPQARQLLKYRATLFHPQPVRHREVNQTIWHQHESRPHDRVGIADGELYAPRRRRADDRRAP